jgi:uncharacterized protein involved in outer membrane biogenesis
MSPLSRWRDLLWRWRRWLGVLLILVIVRAALPEVLRRVLISQASQMLHARVEVGDVDLSLLRGGVALEDVAIWASATPTVATATNASPPQTRVPAATVAADPPAAPSPSAEPSPPAAVGRPVSKADQPLIAWKRLAVELRWLPLFRKTIQLRKVVLDSPHVALDRLANGQINLMALVPVSHKPAEPAPAPTTAKAEWGFGVDRFVLRRGGLVLRDFKVKDSEPLEMNLEEISVRDLALRPGFYGQPATLHLQLAFDQASLRLDARFTTLEQGFGVDADLEANGLPLRRSRLYIPRVGWSALQGEIDAALHYQLQTGKQNEVRGTVSLRNVAVRVSKLEEPALAWKNLTVKVDPVDLIAHRAAVAEVVFDGASLLVRPQGRNLLPFLAASTNNSASAVAQATPAAKAPPAKATTAAKPEENPWHWSLASLRVDDARVRLLGAEAPVDVGVAASVSGLADSGDQPGKVDLTISNAKGQIALKGAVKVTPPAFGGSLKIAALSLPELAHAAGAVPRALLQSARLSSDLKIEAGLAATGDGSASATSDLHVSGQLALAGLQAAGVAPQNFAVTAKSIELGIGQLDVPGVLPSSGPATAPDLRFKGQLTLSDLELTGPDPKAFSVGAHAFEVPITSLSVPGLLPMKGQSPGPIRVTLGKVRLDKPTVQVTRTAEGFALPDFSAAPATTPPSAPTESAPPRSVEVKLASLRIDKGDVAMTDRTVKPFFNGRLSPLDVDLSQVGWPGPSVSNLKLSAIGSDQGKLDVYGALSGGTGWFQVYVDKLALTPFNPYATRFSSYSIASGKLSMSAKASFDKGDYYADNWITLHDLDVQGGAGESLFQQQFGVPLSMALALLRDVNGNIDLGIPVSGGAEGTKIGLFTVIRTALQHAVINALASPLKLVGAVFGGNGEAKPLVPAPISFLPGRSEPASEGAAQVGQLGELLASRPGIGVTLETALTEGDVRWLREQELLKTWQNEGLFAKLGALTQKGTRDRVRDALEARAKDKPGQLSPEDTKALDGWLAAQPAIAPARLHALAEARLQRVQKQLQESSGVAGNRIKLAEPAAQLAQGAPVVSVKLGAAGSEVP